MRIKFYSIFLVCFLLAATKNFSQITYGSNVLTEKPNTPINEMINGYIEVLPVDYNPAATDGYPLIIFLEGQNQFGDGSPQELKNLYGSKDGTDMLPDLVVKNQFTNNYVVNGTTFKFILIIPQIRAQVRNGRPEEEQMASPSEVNDIISYALQNYNVDVRRIYLVGLSLGGGSVWNYAGSSVDYGNRVAAIVPMEGASNLWNDHSRVTNIAAANLPVWTFVVDGDHPYDTLAQRYIDSLNTHSEYTAERLITIYPPGNHFASWENPLKGITGNATYPDLFEWLLTKQSRISISKPLFAVVNAGVDQALTLSGGSVILSTNNISFSGASVTLSGSATAASGRTISTKQWIKVNGQGGTITNPNSFATDITGLKPGFYTFQLRVVDDQGLVSVDNVNVSVTFSGNNYAKVEAENYSELNPGLEWWQKPVLVKSYIDDGPAYGLGEWSSGKWAQYALNLPVAGMYALYYRYKSIYNNPSVSIVADGINYPRTWFSTSAWRSDSIKLHLNTNSTIQILFNSGGDQQLDFDYFELVLLSSDAPLPVKFVYFNALCQNSLVNLQWKTAQEQNSSSFSVQRSTDGMNWTEIGSVIAAGQSAQERSYVFVDRGSLGSVNFYRVVEKDYSGQQTISSVVKSSCSARNEISLYPNPSSGSSVLSVVLDRAANVTVQILDSKGALMQQKQVLLPQGSSTVALDVSSYAKGIYTVKVTYNSEVKTIKMVRK